jgi:hypothetical protein
MKIQFKVTSTMKLAAAVNGEVADAEDMGDYYSVTFPIYGLQCMIDKSEFDVVVEDGTL